MNLIMEVVMLSLASVFTSFIVTLIQRRFTDIDLMRNIKAEIKKISKEMKETKDTKKINELMSKSFELQGKMMKHNMKPMMYSSILVIGVFYILSIYFKGVSLPLPFSLPFIGNSLGWFGIYIIVSVISGLIFRKIFNLGY